MSVNTWQAPNIWVSVSPPTQVIGSVTVSFGKEVYSVKYKENTITVNFKE